jgi:hypothetical protein
MPTGDDGKVDKLGKTIKKHADKIQDEIDKLTSAVKKAVKKKGGRKRKR